jgi:hypothetical protein
MKKLKHQHGRVEHRSRRPRHEGVKHRSRRPRHGQVKYRGRRPCKRALYLTGEKKHQRLRRMGFVHKRREGKYRRRTSTIRLNASA